MGCDYSRRWSLLGGPTQIETGFGNECFGHQQCSPCLWNSTRQSWKVEVLHRTCNKIDSNDLPIAIENKDIMRCFINLLGGWRALEPLFE
jgi:hypothetical protein